MAGEHLEFRDLCNVLSQLERKAYAAIGKEDDTAKIFAYDKSESHLHKRFKQYEPAHQRIRIRFLRADQAKNQG